MNSYILAAGRRIGELFDMFGSCAGVLTGVRCWTSRSEAEAGVLREMERRCSWLSAWGREPYMEGEKKLAERLGLPMASHRLRSSCKAQIQISKASTQAFHRGVLHIAPEPQNAGVGLPNVGCSYQPDVKPGGVAADAIPAHPHYAPCSYSLPSMPLSRVHPCMYSRRPTIAAFGPELLLLT